MTAHQMPVLICMHAPDRQTARDAVSHLLRALAGLTVTSADDVAVCEGWQHTDTPGLYLAEDAGGEEHVWAESPDGLDWPLLSRRDFDQTPGSARPAYISGADCLWALITSHIPAREDNA